MEARQRKPAVSGTGILADVLCGVDGTRSAYEAVRQAASLTTTDGHLTLLAVTEVKGSGQFEQAVLAPERAKRALDHARRIARKAGVSSTREVADRGRVTDVVLDRAGGHDVLAYPGAGLVGSQARGDARRGVSCAPAFIAEQASRHSPRLSPSAREARLSVRSRDSSDASPARASPSGGNGPAHPASVALVLSDA